ncbi:MAG: hypothetical protein ABJB12_04250 [Pseudomonadota bacterium]
MVDNSRSSVRVWRCPTPARFILLVALGAIGCASSATSAGGGAGTGSGAAGATSSGGSVGVSGAASSGASSVAGSFTGTAGTGTGTAGAFSSGGSGVAGSSAGGSSAGGASGGSTSHGGSAGASGATSSGGSGGGTVLVGMKSKGCGQTSTVTFGAIPGEDATATPGGPKNGTGKGGYVKITSGGAQRGFAMRLPDGYDNTKPYPLFFGFHWNGGTAAAQDTGGDNGYFTAYYGIQRKSKNGMFFVAPDSIGAGWNNAGDLKFTDDMVKQITDNYCIDMTNIITSGFSWGGGMSYALACARASAATDGVGYAFRAAIIFEGAVLSGCEGGNDPIAIWQKAGLTDTTCTIGAGQGLRDRFVKNNQCTGWTSETGNVSSSTTGMSAAEPPRPPNPGKYINPGGHVCTDYTGCSSGHPIRWCVDQSGHGNATTDGTSSLYDECANRDSTHPMGNCSPGCPCTWTPDDVWTWLNDPSVNKYTPNATVNN